MWLPTSTVTHTLGTRHRGEAPIGHDTFDRREDPSQNMGLKEALMELVEEIGGDACVEIGVRCRPW